MPMPMKYGVGVLGSQERRRIGEGGGGGGFSHKGMIRNKYIRDSERMDLEDIKDKMREHHIHVIRRGEENFGYDHPWEV